MASRSELTTQVGRLIGRDDTNFKSTIQGFLNQSIREWARLRPWIGLKRRLRLPTNGTRFLTLPDFVERPLQVFDVTNAFPVFAGGNWDTEFPGAVADGTSGRLLEWQDMGTVPTVADPSGRITVASETADSGCNLRITGLLSDSSFSGTALELQHRAETLMLTGTSALTSTQEYSEILSIGKDDDTGGFITIRDATTSTPIARLDKFARQTKYRRIELVRIPGAGTVLEVTALLKPEELNSDFQSPHPSIDEDFLIWNTAGLALNSIGERQAGLTFLQKARSIADQSDFRDKNFGDQHLRMIPVIDSVQAEEDIVD